MKTIHKQETPTKSSWQDQKKKYFEIVSTPIGDNEVKFKVFISLDSSYAKQSRAYVSKWTGNGWAEICILFGELTTGKSVQKLRDELLGVALEVCE